MCTSVTKMLQIQNLKGMTPLISAVDHGNYEIFRFLIDLSVHIQRTNPSKPILAQTVDIKDAK